MSARALIAAGMRRDAALSALRDAFEAAGLDEAALDARLLLQDAAGVSRAALVTRPEAPVDADQAASLCAMAARRLAGESVSRILGKRGFWSLDLVVTPAVLDPRPDTETLVEAALDGLGARRGDALRIVDFGAGSGAILAALLVECPAAFGVAVDRSEAAARVARANFERAGVAARAATVVGDWDAALAGRFDLLVSNPPYIRTGDIGGLPREVRRDPLLALDGGADGLEPYRTLAPAAARLLAPGGVAAFEIGAGQAGDVSAILAAAGLRPGPPRRDLGGVERVVTAGSGDAAFPGKL